ncbi:adenylate/guanylate cyclase domain-containing protein [Bacteroidota bacterium]
MSEERKLAVIVFTDISGYTSLMGKDEDQAFEMLKKNHAIHERIINKYNGTLIKELGDGMLISFSLSSDAVRCAIEIQKECKEQSIPLKCGVHLGEMVMAGEDLLGDGVNIASRLQDISAEGCITISGKVYSDIKNKAGINTKYIGEKKLKGVDDPVKVYEVLCEEDNQKPVDDNPVKSKSRLMYYIIAGIVVVIVAFLIWQFLPTKEQEITPIAEESETVEVDRSIAVLPFTNMSNDPEQEYFSDGMTEEILTHLFKIGDLVVKSRTSVMGYKGTTKKITEIADELGVKHVLEGSVRKVGNRVRITAQLIDAVNDIHLWAETYEKDLSDVFAIQSEVAQKIASSLKITIDKDVKERIETFPTDNMTAYDYYLKGNEFYWSHWGADDKKLLFESIEYYKKAVDLDQNFSLAYTGLGRSYWRVAFYEPNSKGPELLNKSKSYLNKAIDLDPYNGWAYAEMSFVSIDWDWDSAATRQNLDMAIKLMPNDRNAYIHYFYFEQRLGNCDKMESIRQELKRFNEGADHPYSSPSFRILFCQKRYSEIVQIADEYWGDDIPPNVVWMLFQSYIILNEFIKANEVVEYIRDHYLQKYFYYVTRGMLEAKQGDKESALEMCDSLFQLSSTGRFRNESIAYIYAGLGEKEEMYKYIYKALESREGIHEFIINLPKYISCQDDKEFQDINRKIWIPFEGK